MRDYPTFPHSPYCLYFAAQEFRERRRYAEAARRLDELSQIYPGFPLRAEAAYHRAMIYLELDEFDEAYKAFTKLAAECKGTTVGHHARQSAGNVDFLLHYLRSKPAGGGVPGR